MCRWRRRARTVFGGRLDVVLAPARLQRSRATMLATATWRGSSMSQARWGVSPSSWLVRRSVAVHAQRLDGGSGVAESGGRGEEPDGARRNRAQQQASALCTGGCRRWRSSCGGAGECDVDRDDRAVAQLLAAAASTAVPQRTESRHVGMGFACRVGEVASAEAQAVGPRRGGSHLARLDPPQPSFRAGIRTRQRPANRWWIRRIDSASAMMVPTDGSGSA